MDRYVRLEHDVFIVIIPVQLASRGEQETHDR